MQLLVKGTKFEAAREAANRGIPAVFVRDFPRFRETLLKTSDPHADKVQDWFLEDTSTCGIGSLLWYQSK